jgi:hypothetical protein
LFLRLDAAAIDSASGDMLRNASASFSTFTYSRFRESSAPLAMTMCRFLLAVALFFTVVPSGAAGPRLLINAQQADFRSSPAYVRDHFAHIETLPFDGLVLTTISGSKLMAGEACSAAEIAREFAPVRGLPFVRMKHNFAWVNVDRPADFYGDWSVTIENFRTFARVLRDSGIKGIFFDNEEYRGQLFNYPDDCTEPLKSLEEYRQQARRRGREIMEAIKTEYPDIVFLVLHGPYSSFTGTPVEVHRGQTNPTLEELRGPFSIGLMEGMESRGRFIDGGEVYAYRTPEDFQLSYDYRKFALGSDEVNCPFIPQALRRVWPLKLHVGFGVYNLPFGGANMNPALLGLTLERALSRADDYVWLYFEEGNWNAPGEISLEWMAAVIAAKARASMPPVDPAPWISITTPANGSTVLDGEQIKISADAVAGLHPLSRVEFFDGATKLGEAFTAPYSIEWKDPAPGPHVLTARAIDAAGEVAVSSAVTVDVSTAFKASINFQPSMLTPPVQYVPDDGRVFQSRGNGLVFGWNVDHSENTRYNGGSTDFRLQTLCQMRQGARWEVALPNGAYRVTVAVGSATFASIYTINVEGISYWAGEPLAGGHYVHRTETIAVTDGRLTIDNGNSGHEETRISYVLIAAAESVPEAAAGLTAVASATNAVDLRWTDNSSNESHFELERSTAPDFSSSTHRISIGRDISSYRDTEVVAGQTYYYRIRASNSGGTSAFSGTTSAAVRWPDIDDDGIPDPLETPPFVVGIDDRLVDSDGDRMSNAAEYIAGTDPLASRSRFAIIQTSMVREEPLRVTLCFPTVAGREYFIDFSQTLPAEVWTLVPGSELIGDGNIQCRTNSVSEDGRRFYRAHVIAGDGGSVR